MILKVGLTGGTASGKSTVARFLAEMGCVVVDADRIVHDLYQIGEEGHRALVEKYGEQILRPDGSIDRHKLASIAFSTTQSTAELNALIHPLVIAREEKLMQKAGDDDRIFVVEATLLLEAGGRERYDKIVIVEASPEIMLERAVRRGMKREDAQRRISRQMSSAERLRQADYVIRNEGDIAELAARTREVYERLQADLVAKKNR